MGICKLCQKNYKLVNSHIIPKFIHKKIDPKKNRPLVIYENLKTSHTNDMGIKVSSHKYEEFEKLTISKNNKYIWVVDYSEITQIIEISNVLNRINND